MTPLPSDRSRNGGAIPTWTGLFAVPQTIIDVATARAEIEAAVAGANDMAGRRTAAVGVLRRTYAEGRAAIAGGNLASRGERIARSTTMPGSSTRSSN